jgi:hypothetical protein
LDIYAGINESDYQNIGNQTITKILEKEIQRLVKYRRMLPMSEGGEP